MVVFESEVRAEIDPVALLEKTGALLYGEFTLASGKTTDYYFDSKLLTLDPEGARFIAEQLVRKLKKENIDVVGGTAYSAIPIASHICLYSGYEGGQGIPAFYMRKESKGHGTNEMAEGILPRDGQNVAIVEDVVTTGGSLLDSIRKFESVAKEKGIDGYTLKHVFAILDRGEGGREAVEKEGYDFWALFTMTRTADGSVTFQYNGF
ncbi:MAG: orotate phosphoribosyltransferase [Chloroflexota bacterium]|nr:orotate phosphoribosyltransferase [Chloroflexota bacterium]